MAKASDIIKQAQAWVGRKESDGSHKEIIDVYNSHKPLARGYRMKYTDAWCAAFVTAVAIKCDATNIIPKECGCEPMINLFKKMGCFEENEAVTPAGGWIVFYDWQDNGQGDNRGYSDHVGIVEKVENGKITIIEGNYSNSVKRRTLAVNAKNLRGYGVPKYEAEPVTEVKPEVKPVETPVVTEKKYYRVRLSWDDAKSQKGAYEILENAKKSCPEGYTVYDWDGKAVYTNAKVESQPTPSPTPAPTPVPTPVVTPTTPTFTLGQAVKLKSGATYSSGKTIPSWVFAKTLYVRKITNDNIVISTLKEGDVTGTVKASNLELLSVASSAPTSSPAPAAPSNPVIGTAVAKTSMKVRNGASINNTSTIGYISKGQTVEVLERLSNGWYKIVWKKAACGYAYTSNAGNAYYTYTGK